MTVSPNILNLPNESHFRALVQSHKESPSRIRVHDPGVGVDADLEQLLRDVHATRQSLVAALPAAIFGPHGNIISDDEVVYVPVLAPGNYEFIVASVAVLAIGAAIVPLSPAIIPEEASYMINKCNSAFLLAAHSLNKRARDIEQYAASEGKPITVVPVEAGSEANPTAPITATIEEGASVSPSRPSLIIFTSGTTGPPKGVVHTRRILLFPHGQSPSTDSISLTHRDPHWIGGFLQFIRPVFGGWRQEVIRSDAQLIWERFRQGGVTMVNFVPPLWGRLMNFYNESIAGLPVEQRKEYLHGLHGLRSARVGTAAAPPALMKFWRTLGKPLMVTYGSTELGGMGLRMTEDTDPDIKACIGRPGPGIEVRLSGDEEGELLVKNNVLFSHYLNDEAATTAAFTSDGFYRTGDEVRRVGKDYMFLGRSSSDFIRYYGYKIPILQLENHLRNVPYVTEAHALPVPDAQTGSRVGVLVRFDPEVSNMQPLIKLDLLYLREHLSENLEAFKLPTAMRIMNDGNTVLRTGSEKILRRHTAEKFFPVSDDFTLPSEVEIWPLNQTPTSSEKSKQGQPKAWDWGGIQMGALYGTPIN